MTSLSSRERRLVAIALLLAVVAIAILGIINPVLSGFSSRAVQRQKLIDQYSQNERLTGRTTSLRKMAEVQKQLLPLFLLAAPNAEDGSELLKARLEAALEKSGGELRASESLEVKPGWAGAGISALVTNDQLTRWLNLLTSEQPYLLLESINITADRALNSGRLDGMDVKIEASIPLAQAKPR